MDLALQFGWGMMAHSRTLVNSWSGGSIVLSPRDLSEAQLGRLASDVVKLGGLPLVDPQFYLPHSDHERLCGHAYWPGEFEPDHRMLPEEWVKLLSQLGDLNDRLGCTVMLLPGILAAALGDLDSWIEQHDAMLAEAERMGLLSERDCLATIAVGSEVGVQSDGCQRIIEWFESRPISGAYLVMEHPGGSYLSDNPSWLGNVLDLVGALRLQGKEVLVGYSNQEMLVTAAAGASAIVSGTWMNVRSFPPEKFRRVYDDEMRQRKTWYYAPKTLSEYGLPYLDIAARQGLLDLMRPWPTQESTYSAPLFTAPQPSTADFSEADAFLHYLCCLREQARSLTMATFDETLAATRDLLNTAEESVGCLRAREISGQSREFGTDVVQACRAALAMLETGLGPRLRRAWTDLQST